MISLCPTRADSIEQVSPLLRAIFADDPHFPLAPYETDIYGTPTGKYAEQNAEVAWHALLHVACSRSVHGFHQQGSQLGWAQAIYCGVGWWPRRANRELRFRPQGEPDILRIFNFSWLF